ncbi:MAG: 50S ribosomal protein L29 [Cyanobacteria bacterium P01_C01_bin.89]
MALPKVEDTRKLSDSELAERVVAVKQELFQLRMKRSLRQEIKPHEFKHLKHELSQLLTVEHQRKQGASEGSTSDPSSQEE